MFDDGESEESSYVLARVPLLPLAQGRTNITDTFILTQVRLQCILVVDLSITMSCTSSRNYMEYILLLYKCMYACTMALVGQM